MPVEQGKNDPEYAWKLMYAQADKETQENLRSIALESYRQELEFLWQRSNFFWIFTSLALGAFQVLRIEQPLAALGVACFGLFSSFSWTLLNRGSKYWYESWEKKVQSDLNLGIWFVPVKSTKIDWLAGRRFSPSKLIIGISDYITVGWLAILIYHFVDFNANFLLEHLPEYSSDAPISDLFHVLKTFLDRTDEAVNQITSFYLTSFVVLFTILYSAIICLESDYFAIEYLKNLDKSILNLYHVAKQVSFMTLLAFVILLPLGILFFVFMLIPYYLLVFIPYRSLKGILKFLSLPLG